MQYLNINCGWLTLLKDTETTPYVLTFIPQTGRKL